MAKANEAAVDQVQGSTGLGETKETKSPTISTKGPAQLTLGQLIGGALTTIIDEGHGKRMPEFRNQLKIWYDAQSLEDRKAQVLESKRKLELARSVLESVFEHYRMISMVDSNG